MPPPDPMKQTLYYDQLSCRLSIEGLPDVSVGQGGAMVGIITGWSLRLAGKPELEGRREHLQALLQAVLPYARCLISEVPRPCGGGERPARIEPAPGSGHRLSLRSSQEGVEPLQLLLDDAELADLVRVLDGLRLDPRVSLTWDRVSRRRRLAAPAAGVAALAAAAVVAAMVPPPRSVLPPSPPPPPPVDRP
jgi:hypothetical protein